MSKRPRYLLVAVGLLVAACDVGVTVYRPDDGPPSVARFAGCMRVGNVRGFVDDLNEVKRDGASPEILAFLESTWQQARTSAPPAFLKQEIVLVELAATLAQERRSHATPFDDAEFHEVIRRGANSEDPDTRMRALFALANFNDAEDLPILAQAVESTDDSVFRTAIVILASICSSEAQAIVLRTERVLPRDRLAFMKEARAHHYCELR